MKVITVDVGLPGDVQSGVKQLHEFVWMCPETAVVSAKIEQREQLVVRVSGVFFIPVHKSNRAEMWYTASLLVKNKRNGFRLHEILLWLYFPRADKQHFLPFHMLVGW